MPGWHPPGRRGIPVDRIRPSRHARTSPLDDPGATCSNTARRNLLTSQDGFHEFSGAASFTEPPTVSHGSADTIG